MDKINVNGPEAHPLYQFLRSRQPQSLPRGNRSPAGSSAIEWYDIPPVTMAFLNKLPFQSLSRHAEVLDSVISAFM